MTKVILAIVGSLFLVQARECKTESSVPRCILNLIEEAKIKPVQNPSVSVFQYDYLGRKVYYVSLPCCDQFNYVFDEHCEKICAPDGGFTGNGDGNCNDFFSVVTGKTLIWQDERTH